jgi:type I restriction enzyme, S subunit
MSFPRHARYNSTGARWLREIPTHWDIGQSRRLFALRNERARDSDRQLTASQEYGVIFQDDFVAREGRRVMEVITGADILKHVEPNDFVISMRSFQGGLEWCNLRGCISSAYVMLVPCERVHAAFFAYLFKSPPYIQALQSTTNLVRDGQALRYANFTQIDLPLVPLDEQVAIASFLDRETKNIDALVSEQRHLIELLAEKRQATISHAITKGLDPDAVMKPSGFEWLGDVPTHWIVKPLRRFKSRVQTGPFGSQLHAAEYVTGGTPVINPINLVDGEIVPSDDITVEQTVVARLAYQKLRAGDIVFSRRGELGRCAVVTAAKQGWLCGTGSMILRLEVPEFDPEFVSCFLRLDLTKQYFQSLSVGAIMDSLSSSTLLGMPMLAPPLEEQGGIASSIRLQAATLDRLIAEVASSIELLQERRVALISAAVTGQIDVRGLVEAEVA